MLRHPEKGSDVLYHDPVSREACAAKVVKVHPTLNDVLIPRVNLVFWTEEGASDKARDVAHGPGEMGRWWFPGETSGPGKAGG